MSSMTLDPTENVSTEQATSVPPQASIWNEEKERKMPILQKLLKLVKLFEICIIYSILFK